MGWKYEKAIKDKFKNGSDGNIYKDKEELILLKAIGKIKKDQKQKEKQFRRKQLIDDKIKNATPADVQYYSGLTDNDIKYGMSPKNAVGAKEIREGLGGYIDPSLVYRDKR